MSRKLCCSALVALGVMTAYSIPVARADDETSTAETIISPGEIQKTPEMWFYEQAMRQYNDPRVARRTKAEFRAQQRRARIAAMNWFGFSNARPTVTFTPMMTPYSPVWAGNGFHPEQWRGNGTGVYRVTREVVESRVR